MWQTLVRRRRSLIPLLLAILLTVTTALTLPSFILPVCIFDAIMVFLAVEFVLGDK